MSANAEDDLISLADESTVTSSVSSSSIATTSSKTVANGRSPVKRDSFSHLAVMMKAKKPYTPISPPSPRIPLSIAFNSMQFASRVSSGSSILSPLARSYHADGSVAQFLQEQARSPPTAVNPPTSDYSEQKMQRLESMLEELDEIPVDDEEDDNDIVQSAHANKASVQPLLPGFEPLTTFPTRTGLVTSPTPADSTEPQRLPADHVSRIIMHAWETMGRDLEVLEEENRALELKIARLQKLRVVPPGRSSDQEEELHTEIGRLKYQNEQNKTQKATMARTLSQKDVEIKQLQLDLDASKHAVELAERAATTYAEVVSERDHLQAQLGDDRISNSCLLEDLIQAKDREIQIFTQQIDDLQEVARRSKEEGPNREPKNLAEVRLEALNKCEKQLKSVNAKYATEHARVNELEDLVESFQLKLEQAGDLQAQLSQKSADCDRWRTKYKNQEKMVETWKRQIERAADENTCLRGAAHLVKPAIASKLSPVVMSCSECYAKNINCDNKARCRNCTENNEDCARWRCSLRHHLGQCARVPCTFPHGEDGWLLAPEPRPQW